MSSSSTPCAACKFQRRKCTQDCVFAPYFPPDHIQKFINVHNIFGRSNVCKLLKELPASQREDAVNSLAYEAEARLREPVYGCVGYISMLQQRLRRLQAEINCAKRELSTYIGSQAMLPILQPQPYLSQNGSPSSYNMTVMGIQPGLSHESQQQQYRYLQPDWYESQQTMAANLQLQQLQEQNFMGFNSGFDAPSTVTATGFSQLTNAGVSVSPPMDGVENSSIYTSGTHHLHEQPLLQPPEAQPSQVQNQQQQQSSAGSE